MPAQNEPLYIEQGATFRRGFVYKQRNLDGTIGDPVDLTGYRADLQVRRTASSTTYALWLSTEWGDIALGSDGSITISASDAATSTLTAKQYVYDLELISPDGDVYRAIEGKVKVGPQVTRIENEVAPE